MNAIEITASTLESTGQMLSMFLSDLSDADLLVCPVEGANHIAWQIGHSKQPIAVIPLRNRAMQDF
jgi:hypothetical protein